ncbi:MAG: type IV pilin protein [Lautropia sp.]
MTDTGSILPGVRSRGANAGFTLLEVMIVVAVVAILTAIAVPSYQESIRRGHRSEARAALLQAAQFMERVRTERNTYAPGAAIPALPASIAQVPASGTARYTLTVTAAAGTSYTVRAQATGTMSGDVCGDLTIDQTGLRAFSGGGGTMALCWER